MTPGAAMPTTGVCRGCGSPAMSPPSPYGCAVCRRLSLDLAPPGTVSPSLRILEDAPGRLAIELDRSAYWDPSWFLPLVGLPFLFWLPYAFAREGLAVALPPLVLVLAFTTFALALAVHRRTHRTTVTLADGVLRSTSLGIFTRHAAIPVAEIKDLQSTWLPQSKAGRGAQLAATRSDGWPVVLWFNVKDGAAVACVERKLREHLGFPL